MELNHEARIDVMVMSGTGERQHRESLRAQHATGGGRQLLRSV
jgi:hypothetical protein